LELFKKTDPLIKIFREKYGMNLLSVPREDASVGDLYVYDTHRKAVSSKGSIVYFLTPTPIIPKPKLDASMADVTATMTKEVDFSAGLSLVSGFLEKLGIGSLLGKVKASYDMKGARTIKFNFPNAAKDSVDAMQFGQNLIKTKPIPNHPFYSKDNKYFLVMAVAKTSAITITVQDATTHNADIDIDALNQDLVNSNAKISKDNNSAITFNGDKKLGFAVELQELIYDGKNKRILLKPTADDIAIKGLLPMAAKKHPGLKTTVFVNME
jgi:hypothetical protein